MVDTGYAGIHHSKYWMPIHYDTIEDGQNKKSHLLFSKYWMPIRYDTIEDGQNKNSNLLFSFLVRIVLFFCILSVGFIVKNIITFHWLHLNNYTPY